MIDYHPRSQELQAVVDEIDCIEVLEVSRITGRISDGHVSKPHTLQIGRRIDSMRRWGSDCHMLRRMAVAALDTE